MRTGVWSARSWSSWRHRRAAASGSARARTASLASRAWCASAGWRSSRRWSVEPELPRARRRPRAARALLAGRPHQGRRTPRGGGGLARGPEPLHGLRRDAVDWPLAPRSSRPSASWSAARMRSIAPRPRCTCSSPPAPSRSGSGSSRSRSATSVPSCTTSSAASGPAWPCMGADGRASGLCWVEPGRRDRPGGRRAPPGPGAGGAGRARPGGEDPGARRAARVLHHRQLVAACAASWRSASASPGRAG